MDRQEMRQIVDRIIEIDPKFKKFQFSSPEEEQIDPKPGASEADLATIAPYFPDGKLPPSYAMLLELHNGISYFKYVDSALYSVDELVSRLSIGLDGRGTAGETEENRIFFIVGEDWEAVGFDTTTASADGEMEIVEYNNSGEIDRWKSLPEFLRAYVAWLENAYATALADRKDLEE